MWINIGSNREQKNDSIGQHLAWLLQQRRRSRSTSPTLPPRSCSTCRLVLLRVRHVIGPPLNPEPPSPSSLSFPLFPIRSSRQRRRSNSLALPLPIHPNPSPSTDSTPSQLHCLRLVCHFSVLPVGEVSLARFIWVISHRPTTLFSQNKSATSNQLVVFFSQNKLALATSQTNRLSVIVVSLFWGFYLYAIKKMVPTCVPLKRSLAPVCHQPKLLCPVRHSVPTPSIFHR
jgi:hypothetical protein